jgi:flagellar protein FliS
MINSYQEQSLTGAIDAVEANDTLERRTAVKKFIDILMYLQARLRPDLGAAPAAALSEFYTAMFTLALEASHESDLDKFYATISNVRNVRDAWVIAARDPEASRVLPRELRTREERFIPTSVHQHEDATPSATSWSA